MINPIVIIIASALLLSVLVISFLNKPSKPFITGTLIFILISFVLVTWLIDSCISNYGIENQYNGLVNFFTMLDSPTYAQLETSFHTFMIIDIVLFILSLISIIVEAMFILKNYGRK